MSGPKEVPLQLLPFPITTYTVVVLCQSRLRRVLLTSAFVGFGCGHRHGAHWDHTVVPWTCCMYVYVIDPRVSFIANLA
jgi:hypothetical protein